MTSDDITLAVVLIITAAVGYFIVSKAVDFFKRGSTWDEKVPPGLKDLSNPQNEDEDRDPTSSP